MLSATHRGTCAFKNLPTEPPQAFRAGLRAFSAQAFHCPSFGQGALGLRPEDAKVNRTCRQSEPYLLPARPPRGGLSFLWRVCLLMAQSKDCHSSAKTSDFDLYRIFDRLNHPLPIRLTWVVL
jgi:hypothetical protein